MRGLGRACAPFCFAHAHKPRFLDRSDHEVDACYHSWEDRGAIDRDCLSPRKEGIEASVSPSQSRLEDRDCPDQPTEKEESRTIEAVFKVEN